MDYSIYINGSGVLAVSKALSSATKQDVIDALLFTQLAADEDFPEDPNGLDWLEAYKGILYECGWVYDRQNVITGTFTSIAEKAFSLREVFATVFESNLEGEQATVLLAALDKVAELPDKLSVEQTFRQYAALKVKGLTRIRACIGVVNERGSLSIASVFFDTRGSVGRLFTGREFAFSDLHGAVNAYFYTARFNAGIYGEYREDTVQWLGARRQSECLEIANLTI
ncbi:hypothetical protein PMI35_02902 [Pseudomonas sp. GM78]|uniref:hypothetical protein n=1 Tax=Pseudomonas sp. GM78 TaxID=1144337 RepID=UPI0002708236|nr:hypothetical protein [Pseudomonas sp. GM78]EJN28688.1 hypothetical protein PMI35_02902 [Pseudomonas sp. GM78]